MINTPISRRSFAAIAASAAVGALLPRGIRGHAWSWPGYDRAIVIDNLATPGPFNVPSMFAKPWTDAMVANAGASGITAVNVTINGTGLTGAAAFESTVRNVAFLERELNAHPVAFLRVRGVADIRRAKETSRVGLIAGFQDATMLESDLSRVDVFRDLGVRIIQLTYNVRNLLGAVISLQAGPR